MVCHLFDQPFIDYSKLYLHNYLNEKINNVMNHSFYSIVQHQFFYKGFHSFILTTKPHFLDISNISNVKYFSLLFRLFQYIEFIALLELVYYLFHRLNHTPFFYKHFHSHHHKNKNIFPIDAFESDFLDHLGFTLSLNMPLLLIPLHYYEYSFLYYFYSTGIILVHSSMITNIHVHHHKYFKINYCLLFPFYDKVDKI